MYEDNRQFYIVSEVLNGGELYERISEQDSLDEVQSADFVK
jgi:hypothetical protein